MLDNLTQGSSGIVLNSEKKIVESNVIFFFLNIQRANFNKKIVKITTFRIPFTDLCGKYTFGFKKSSTNAKTKNTDSFYLFFNYKLIILFSI